MNEFYNSAHLDTQGFQNKKEVPSHRYDAIISTIPLDNIYRSIKKQSHFVAQ